MKKVLKIIGIIVLVLAFGLAGLYLYADNKPYIGLTEKQPRMWKT